MTETRDERASPPAEASHGPKAPDVGVPDHENDAVEGPGADHAEPSFLRRSASVVYDVYRDFIDNRGTGLSAEVTFFGILSIFPALLVTAALLGFLSPDLRDAAQLRVHDFLTTVLTSDAEGIVSSMTGLFDQQSGGLLTFATILALYSVSRGFQAIIRALNIAYDVEDPRGWITTRAIGLVMALVTIVLVFMILAGVVILPTIADNVHVAGLRITANYVAVPAVFAVAVAWIMTIYHFAPYHRTRWRADLWGAMVCAVLWILFSIGFRLYLALSAGSNQVLTALGGGLVALLWMYLMVIAIMLGAELNSVLWRHGLAKVSSSGSSGFLTRPKRNETHGVGPRHALPTKRDLKARWNDAINGLRRTPEPNATPGDPEDDDN